MDSPSRKRGSRELYSLMRATNRPGPLSPMYRADTTDGTVSCFPLVNEVENVGCGCSGGRGRGECGCIYVEHDC